VGRCVSWHRRRSGCEAWIACGRHNACSNMELGCCCCCCCFTAGMPARRLAPAHGRPSAGGPTLHPPCAANCDCVYFLCCGILSVARLLLNVDRAVTLNHLLHLFNTVRAPVLPTARSPTALGPSIHLLSQRHKKNMSKRNVSWGVMLIPLHSQLVCWNLFHQAALM
jgi:hypothetical protein